MADNSFKEAGKSFADFYQSQELYSKLRHQVEAPAVASNFSREQGDSVAAQTYSDPNTPDQLKAEALQDITQIKQLRLEELIENDFSNILRGAKKEQLKGSLDYFEPKENLSGKYKKIADLHEKVRERETYLGIYQKRNNVDQGQVDAVVNNMKVKVQEHYEEQYKEEQGDSERKKKEKKIIKNMFKRLFSVSDDAAVMKYNELTVEAEKELDNLLKTKEDYADYIEKSISKDTQERVNFLANTFFRKE